MNSLFDGAVAQYIDNNGKTRVINFVISKNEHISLVISPIPPLSVPTFHEKNIRLASLNAAVEFIKKKSLLVVEQDGNKDGIKGIWIETKEQNSGIYYGYIPIVPNKKTIGNIPFSKRNDPIRTDLDSELSIFRQNRKIAEVLKNYVLYTYALHPDDFSEEYFWIDPDHVYDLDALGKKLYVDDNDIIYRDGYILVPSEEVKNGLMAYLKVSLLNDTPGVMAVANAKTIENYYQTISDFRSTNSDQLIFVNKSGLKRWKLETMKRNTSGLEVSASPVEDNKDPYYYKNPKIRHNSLMIIQNVEGGSLEKALSVAHRWGSSRINTGWSTGISNIVGDISCVVYTEMGEIERQKKKTNFVNIFQYENGDYAAILFFI